MKLEGIVDMTRCLLIDDDSQESRNLQQLLDGLGLDTAQAAQTDDALKYCNDNGPDVVMLAASGGRPTRASAPTAYRPCESA
jgi:PleD family two-component response regulator